MLALVVFVAIAMLPMILLGAIHFVIFVCDRADARADARFARKRLLARRDTASVDSQFCLVLRSSRADSWLSVDAGEFGAIQDSRFLRLDIAPGFRECLVKMMRPLHTLFIKNAAEIHDAAVLEYDDNCWQAEVLRDMQDATLLIVIPIWPSSALEWELDRIIEMGYLSKTYFLMPPGHLVRSESFAEATVLQRARRSMRYLMHVMAKFLEPNDVIVIEYPPVENPVERWVDAMIGWQHAVELFAEKGLELPAFNQTGWFVHGQLVRPEPRPATVGALDRRRQLEQVGRHPWWYADGKVLASAAHR